jgi:hypothetical protein
MPVGPYFSSVTGVLTEGWPEGAAKATRDTPNAAERANTNFIFMISSFTVSKIKGERLYTPVNPFNSVSKS